MTEVIMPKMGDGMEEGTLLEWLKKEGDSVKAGEVIGIIQTDKATLELESPGFGVLSGVLVNAGDSVPVGKPIALLLKNGETLPSNWGESNVESKVTSNITESSIKLPSESIDKASLKSSPERIKASPLARKMAENRNISLNEISGTGPGGRIVERDIVNYEENISKITIAENTSFIKKDDLITPSRLKQITAQRTTQSKQQVPHFYVTVEVNLENILKMREMFEIENSGKVSINDFVVKASSLALRDVPEVNASFVNNQIQLFGNVHIGIAAAVDNGLLVPVLKNVDGLTLRSISLECKNLVKKAREGKLHPNEMVGSTFSISNMGMLDVDNFIAIINQPNAAIVAISSARKKVVVNDNNELEIRTCMNITGSFDHRVLDGAIGAKFMNALKDYLENPTRLVS